jgi:hypothetical protein
MRVIEALNWRYAVRQFSSAQIDEEKVQERLTATSVTVVGNTNCLRLFKPGT